MIGTVRSIYLAASERIITGQAVIDKIDWGRTGNVALQLDSKTGGAWQAMDFVLQGRVIRDRHRP